MTFGEVLKKIRTDKQMSLRDLGKELDLSFTFVDKVEKGISPASENFLEKVLECFPLHRKELIEAYTKDYIPTVVIDELKKKDEVVTQAIKNIDVETVFKLFFEKLSVEDRKELLTNILDKFEIKSYKQGTIEEDREEIELIREKIKELK
ncbi:MAG: helix-turn-helix transcriptional regulator [Fusobacterium mortiferum]|jgi:transcriptional regulator with XRE-family HTH domain|nr:helix-turn-helix transcriptional regulator [Fusobacterium mortiferum]MDY4800296.1 helix-turn-helix transcriptional regulator [Fusobacterium mortiferum]MDY5980847.1 helix-turn-helix transcriptional regulator [Fusobacterium mortiferum]